MFKMSVLLAVKLSPWLGLMVGLALCSRLASFSGFSQWWTVTQKLKLTLPCPRLLLVIVSTMAAE